MSAKERSRVKTILAGCLLGVALLAFAGCGKAAQPAASRKQEAAASLAEKSSLSQGREENAVEIIIHTGGKTFYAVLEDNASARAFSEKLPLDVTMTELNGNEKYYKLPESLPSSDQAVGTIHSGDLMLYGGNHVVLFYRDFPTSYRYTKLGRIEKPEGLADAVGTDDVHVIMNRP